MARKQSRKRLTRRRRSTTRNRAQRGGSERQPSAAIRSLRRQIEFDTKGLEFWTEKAEFFKQVVEVAERKLAEQRENNAPARKQIQIDLRVYRDKLREAEGHRDNYADVIGRDTKRLRILERAEAALNATT